MSFISSSKSGESAVMPQSAQGSAEVTRHAEHDRLLYRHAPTGLAVNVALAFLITCVLWDRIAQDILLLWLAGLLLLIMVRVVQLYRYFQTQPVALEMPRWGR